ncbi:hypothetical protein C942_02678 [Photobacterium marinum]|uniref:Integrase n=1 Tax=Photobacterium marinum TaxID=1056511 RepID=L8JEA9_9GAMM|nr:hypothetical protein [Photobacterium marinum]ELR67170.1 hypothetical protein C942_02678 [Photobacterium marinum]
MIKINNVERFESIKKAQNNVGTHTNYLADVLTSVIALGDWDVLERMDIGFTTGGKSLGKINNDTWNIQSFFEPNASTKCTLSFTISDNVLERNLRNQLKALILKMLWVSPRDYSFATCVKTLTQLKKFSIALLDEGMNSFSDITFELLDEWIIAGDVGIDFNYQPTYSALNKLVIEAEGLPFDVNIKRTLIANEFNLTLKEPEQYAVIPQRIYYCALNYATEQVERLYSIRDKIESVSHSLVRFKDNLYQHYAEFVFKKGKAMYLHNGHKNSRIFKDEYQKLASPSLEQIYDSIKAHRPIIRTEHIEKFLPPLNITILGQTLKNLDDVGNFLSNYSACCSWLVMALSGMRIDELYHLHASNGCTNEIISGQKIFTFNADLSKTTKGKQAKQDSFVTTEVGNKAYEVLNAIHRPLRQTQASSNQLFFHRVKGEHSATTKNTLGNNIRNWFEHTFTSELELTSDDMKDLQVSDPKQTEYKLGGTFSFTNHQLRRSFAYYLIGYELLSFPQLKQQFSHVSLAMTRHYAKNASKFQKLKKSTYKEVEDERITQKAKIYLDIYERLANKERVAGGKGKAFAKKRVQEGENNLFTEKRNNDMLTLAYWEHKLRKGERHVHVVAPGIYCTSTNCSLRTQVNLLECVDCDNDYIVDAVFAEAKRKEAEENMHYDILHDELTPQSASECYIKITAAERIMDDLGLDYEPVIYPKEITNMLIPYIGV